MIPQSTMSRTIRLTSLKLISGIGLLMLFPLLFLYHAAVALADMPAFASTFEGPVKTILAPILVLLQARAFWRRTSRLTVTDIIFICLCVYMLLWGLIHFLFSYGYQVRLDLWMQTFEIVVSWIVMFVIFRNFDIQNRKLFLLMLFSGITMLIITLAYQQNGFFNMQLLSTSDADLISYQGAAQSALIGSLFLLCTVRTRWIILIWAGSVVELFLIGARTQFFVFLPVGLLVLYLRSGITKFVVVMVPILIVISLIFVNLASGNMNERIESLLNGPGTDGSLQERNYLSQVAIETIRNHPFTGDYGSHVLVPLSDRGPGSYAHNVLSAWVSFGLIGIMTFMFMLLRGFLLSAKQMLTTRRKDALSIFTLAIATYLLLTSFTSNSVFFSLFGAGFGLFARMEEQKTSKRTYHLT